MFAFCGISGTWAQIDLTSNNDKTWSIAAMPAYDVELQVEYYTDLLETEDNSAWIEDNNGKEASVWLGRTLKSGSYNSFALPFNMDDIPDGWSVKELTGSDFDATSGTLYLTFSTANSIEAGKPYLVKISGSEAITLTGYNDVTIGNANPSTTTYVNFVPTLGKTLVTGPEGYESNAKAVLYLGANNTLYNPTELNLNSYMKGFRAYFQLKDAAAPNARAFRMNFGDEEVTGIMTTNFTNDTNDMNGQWYTIDGRKFSGQPTQKGVYINNGKKIVIK